jgi:hypothetical protein
MGWQRGDGDEKRKERREKRAIKKKGNRHRRQHLKDQLRRNPEEQTSEDEFKFGASERVGGDAPTLHIDPHGGKKKRKPREERPREDKKEDPQIQKTDPAHQKLDDVVTDVPERPWSDYVDDVTDEPYGNADNFM